MEAATAPALRDGAVTKQDKWLRAALWVIAFLSAAFIVDYIRGGLAGDFEFRFVANSVAKDVLFVALAAIAASDVRRWSGLLVPLLILGHAALIVTNGIMLFTDQPAVESFGMEVQATTFALVWMAADAVIVAALFLLHRAAQRERLGLKYLSPLAFRTLSALAEVLIHGRDERLTPDEVAANVDRYLAGLDAPAKWRIHASFLMLSAFPLATLRPPFALMSPRARYDYAKKRFERRRLPRPLPTLARPLILSAQQFVFLGYWGDKRSYPVSRYKRFSDRNPDTEKRKDQPIEIAPAPGDTAEADVVIVGSGAAGSILAYRLAERGRRVLMLERGPYVPPSQFSEDEVDMYLQLYNEGALQLSRDFRFSVLQGMCVGGTTAVNNAVSFETPPHVLDDWSERGAQLDRKELSESFARMKQALSVSDADPARATPGYKPFEDGIKALGLQHAGTYAPVPVNIKECLGCGYCNIGCRHGRKMSMLDTFLPWARQRFGDRVQVLPECKVIGIDASDGHARGVDCEIAGRRVRVRANTVVVSAGAIGSSWLLLRSGIKRSLAGRGLHFNIVTPVTAQFEQTLDSFAGLQISHYFQPEASSNGNSDRWILETWFNPPATQALVMPGWFEDHYANMEAYSRMASGGVMVGTRDPGHVRAKASGPEIVYEPSKRDLGQVVAGLKQLTQIYLKAGSHKVMPTAYDFTPIGAEQELGKLDKYAVNRDLSLNSAHPQGGNPIGADWRSGVVDPSFRVHGMRNLYVCDASVFPTSVGVNPQLTVMALADYAGQRIA